MRSPFSLETTQLNQIFNSNISLSVVVVDTMLLVVRGGAKNGGVQAENEK
jgi:hypothetical protein